MIGATNRIRTIVHFTNLHHICSTSFHFKSTNTEQSNNNNNNGQRFRSQKKVQMISVYQSILRRRRKSRSKRQYTESMSHKKEWAKNVSLIFERERSAVCLFFVCGDSFFYCLLCLTSLAADYYRLCTRHIAYQSKSK